MGLEVYINGELIELQPNINIGLTYQVGSILNLSGRSGNLSNKFTVPKTQNNTRILGTILNINAGTNIPYQRNSGKIVQNGLELFPDGLAIVESSGSSYSLTIYSGNVSFFDLIKGRNINELDWSDSNHVYDIPTIIDSFTNNSDYIYPIVDFGDSVELLDNSNLQNSNSLLPCVRISSVLEKIFTSVGYELKGSFRNIDQYSRLILTPNRFGYLESDINANSGTATDVVLQNDELTIESNIVNPTPFAEIITLDYQTITWEKYLAGKYVPDNNYFGSFELSVQGNLENFIPIAGENGIDSDSLSQNAVWQNGNINDTHACYTSNKNLVNDLIVHEFKTGLNTVITSINGTVSWGVGMTETEGGYIAYSDQVLSTSRIQLYEIATGITTTIYSEAITPGLTNIIEYVKIWNGKVAWFNNGGSGSTEGIWMHDIISSTTKNVTLSLNIANEVDHNGDYLVWEDSLTDDVNIFDFTAGTNSVLNNYPGAATIKTLKVLGDYVTFFTNNGNLMESFKISTSTLVTAQSGAGIFNPGSARTETSLAFCGQDKQLYFYDLLTDTLTTTIETDCTCFNNDEQISLNENYIAYTSNSDQSIKFYDILGGTITTISSTTQIKNKVVLGISNVVFYWSLGSDDYIKYYDIDSLSLMNTINNVVNNSIFLKAFNNDRLLFDNEDISTTTRVSYVNPLKNTLGIDYTIQVLEDGVPIYSQVVNIFGGGLYSGTLNTGNIIVKTGAEYTANFVVLAIKDETISYFTEYDLDLSSFSFAATNRIPYDATIEFSELFDWDQDKLLKDILNQYSLTIQTNEITKQVFLTPLDDLSLNLLKGKDWSNKIDLKREPTTKFRLSGYGQTNYFNYKEDDDVEENFGRGSFTINDTSLEAEKNIITLNAAAVVSGFRVVNNHTPLIPFLTGPGNFFDGKLSRILLLDPKDQLLNFKNTDTAATGSTSLDIPFCYFKKSGKVDNLDFQSLLNDNYTILQGMTDKIKFVSANFILREVDVQNLDFTIPIFLDVNTPGFQANGYFYINKISNFKENAPTKVDLIRL